jgi:hypothetical protein
MDCAIHGGISFYLSADFMILVSETKRRMTFKRKRKQKFRVE